jgi:hypothetical protein
MSEPAREPVPELDAEDALRGVVNQLTINGQRMTVIIPGSVIEALRVFAEAVANVEQAGYLPGFIQQAMPWTAPLNEGELAEFASELVKAAASGDHAPERLAIVMRAWRETAEILADPQAAAELAESAEAAERGDVVRGPDAVRALRSRR